MNKVKEVSVGDVWKRGEFNTTPQKKETKRGIGSREDQVFTNTTTEAFFCVLPSPVIAKVTREMNDAV